VVTEPGLNFKAPFIDTVISIDKRILDLLVEDARRSASEIGRLVSLYAFAPITPAVRTRTCSTR